MSHSAQLNDSNTFLVSMTLSLDTPRPYNPESCTPLALLYKRKKWVQLPHHSSSLGRRKQGPNLSLQLVLGWVMSMRYLVPADPFPQDVLPPGLTTGITGYERRVWNAWRGPLGHLLMRHKVCGTDFCLPCSTFPGPRITSVSMCSVNDSD